jgi:hypothetical protein
VAWRQGDKMIVCNPLSKAWLELPPRKNTWKFPIVGTLTTPATLVRFLAPCSLCRSFPSHAGSGARWCRGDRRSGGRTAAAHRLPPGGARGAKRARTVPGTQRETPPRQTSSMCTSHPLRGSREPRLLPEVVEAVSTLPSHVQLTRTAALPSLACFPRSLASLARLLPSLACFPRLLASLACLLPSLACFPHSLASLARFPRSLPCRDHAHPASDGP